MKHPRRVILCGDLQRFESARALWDPAPDGASTHDALHTAVRTALATVLTDKQREVVEMYFYDGLSQGEIARRLGVTQQIVQKRLYGDSRGGRTVGGALAKLRVALAPVLTPRGIPAIPR